MRRCFVWLALLLAARVPCPVRAEGDTETAPLPPAARRVLDDARQAVEKNRRAFEAANKEALDAAEEALKGVMDTLAKEGKLEEALATKKLLATFREQFAGAAAGSARPKAIDASKRKPVAKAPARGGKAPFNEQFGFADEKRVAEFWEFEGGAQDHQCGSSGITLRRGGTMRSRVGLVGDFEIGVVMNSVWGGPEIHIAGNEIPFVHPNTRIMVTRKGNQLIINQGGALSTLTIPEAEVDQPHYLAITNGDKPLEVHAVAIRAAKVERPEE